MDIAFAQSLDAAETGVLPDIVLRPGTENVLVDIAVVEPGELRTPVPSHGHARIDRLELRERVRNHGLWRGPLLRSEDKIILRRERASFGAAGNDDQDFGVAAAAMRLIGRAIPRTVERRDGERVAGE